MLYYLFEYLESQFQFPGASLFNYISFRSAAAIITSLVISMLFGKKIIEFLKASSSPNVSRETFDVPNL